MEIRNVSISNDAVVGDTKLEIQGVQNVYDEIVGADEIGIRTSFQLHMTMLTKLNIRIV